MKRLFLILILIFNSLSWAKADDIREFQIEGISIGDKLFDHFSNEEFKYAEKNSVIFKQKDNKFHSLLFYKLPKFNTYDGVTLTWFPKNNSYELEGVTGIIYYKDNFENCEDKKKEITNIIKETITNAVQSDLGKRTHAYDKTGKSYFTTYKFEFDTGSHIRIMCTNWSKKYEDDWWDNLEVQFTSVEMNKIMKDPNIY